MMRSPVKYNRSQNSFKRFVPILVIIGLVLLAFLIMRSTGIGGLSNANFETQRNRVIRSEMQAASSAVNSLSRLGATSTSSVLSRVRQHVHGIEVINELSVSMYGEVGRLYPAVTFEEIYGIIDSYEVCLATGQKVNEPLNRLTEAVGNLETTTNRILNFTTGEEE
ncbi:MAG: hypothetical protein E7331_05985 [Clostridiales bacterium]|nr:hypothetical protein [Clostridiales bacterium]